jgi:hypothetical protein
MGLALGIVSTRFPSDMDMLALTNNPKAGFPKRSNGFQVRDAGKFAQSL